METHFSNVFGDETLHVGKLAHFRRSFVKLGLTAAILIVGALLALLTGRLFNFRHVPDPTLGALPSLNHSLEQERMRIRKLGPVRAPELAGGKGWLNTDKPLTLAGLKGKIVLLDFWTYCCINCIHIVPDLKKLESRYPNELVVIGVHSAKFDNEKDSENIRQAILRYEISHPVVNDADFRIWNAYSSRAWPTQVLIDPEGYVANLYQGEGNLDEIDGDIRALIDEFKSKGTLKSEPLNLALERAKQLSGPLSFPAKVLADEAGGRLFISDSNHNRVVVAKLDGTLIDTVGAGTIGRADGDYSRAQFNHPQGMALDGEFLYVADTENHLLRRVNLKTKTVETVAGTGEQGLDRRPDGPGPTTALSSPWDLFLVGRTLYIATAGLHQIWKYDLASGTVKTHAGSGIEDAVDGPAGTAAFAQPSGLASDGRRLFVADSEVSSIRTVDLTEGGKVSTLAGSGDLFGFGDLDDSSFKARFQHPLGVAWFKGQLYVADTYNHKIKVVDPETKLVRTFLGGGRGFEDGDRATFFEPGGLSVAGNRLFIADTNNHAIRVADLKTKRVSTLALKGLTPISASSESKGEEVYPNAETVTLPVQKVKANAPGELVLDVELPAGFHLNEAVSHRYAVRIEQGSGLTVKPEDAKRSAKDLKLPARIAFAAGGAGKAELSVGLTFYFCRTDDMGVCRIQSVIWKIPVEVVADGQTVVKAGFKVP